MNKKTDTTSRTAGMPSQAEIIEFIQSAEAPAGKREIAKAFGLKGQEKIALKKRLKQMAEDGKISLRNHRRSARHELEQLEKDGDLSSDELNRAHKELDRRIHVHEASIDEAFAVKEKELLED